MAKVKLHRCPFMFLRVDGHPCHRVQSALDEAGIEYELVKSPGMRGRRRQAERLSGQRLLPIVEFEDGSCYRAESSEMAHEIESGRLFDHQRADDAAPRAT